MIGVHLVAFVSGLIILAAMFELLRRRQLKEKYAVLWMIVGVFVLILGIFPTLIDAIARPLHIASPPNLLFLVATGALLLVAVHLSWETSRLEDETRELAEEVALMRHELERHQRESRPSEGRQLDPQSTDRRGGPVT